MSEEVVWPLGQTIQIPEVELGFCRLVGAFPALCVPGSFDIISTSMVTKPALSRFRKLVEDISRLYGNAKRAQVQFAWETGKRIVEEEQDGAMKAPHRSALLVQLSDELSRKYGVGFSRRNLSEMRRFFLANPNWQPAANLTWTHQVELMRVKDLKVRRALAARAVKEGLGKNEVRQLVTEVNRQDDVQPFKDLPALKRPADLKLNTFSRSTLGVKLSNDATLVDCGFFVSWPVKNEDLAGLDLKDKPSYTYAATVERVVDGDTLFVLIEVGFGIIVRDKLRLRGVNCPEVGTPEGDKAKKFVEGILSAGSRIVLKSKKSGIDKYGRFVVDVYYLDEQSTPEEIIAQGVYLNQQLLNEGLAVRMEA